MNTEVLHFFRESHKQDLETITQILADITNPEMLNVVTKLYIFKYSSIIKGKNVNIS
jgi:hypothetical protein